ncbi:MAG: hypothetical protein GXP32_07420 [Kiritimatiellaeota bacterium]|nr:hypothetical protein [Kiritimatiellota bacterium]
MRWKFMIAVVAVSFLCVSCGKERPKTAGARREAASADVGTAKRLKRQRTKIAASASSSRFSKENSEKENLLDPDAFSKGFSTPVYKDESEQGEKPERIEIDWNEFYRKGDLATNLFTPGEYSSKKAPVASAAAAVSDGNKYSWLPRWRYDGKGGVELPGRALSSDGSLLAVLETVYPKGAAPSTLLVMINTYNWSVASIRRYRDRVFSDMMFRPRSSKPEILVWERGVTSDAPGHLRVISLRDGSVLSSTDEIQASNIRYALAPSGDFLVLKTDAGTDSLYIFSLPDLRGEPKKIKTKQKFGVPAVSPDSSLVALVGEKAVEVFSSEDLSSIETVKHSLGVSPDSAIFIGVGLRFALSGYSHPCELLVDGDEKILCERSGRSLFLLPKKDRLVFEEYKNSAVTVFDLKKLSVVSTFNPMRIKPKTRGHSLFIGYLPHAKRFVELDSKGNLFLFHQPGRKWRKMMIFSAKR